MLDLIFPILAIAFAALVSSYRESKNDFFVEKGFWFSFGFEFLKNVLTILIFVGPNLTKFLDLLVR